MSTWTTEQRIRVLSVMAGDLTIHQWSEVMECELDEIWRCLSIAHEHRHRALQMQREMGDDDAAT